MHYIEPPAELELKPAELELKPAELELKPAELELEHDRELPAALPS